MGELLDQFIIEGKKLAKFLSIEEVKEEHREPPHHSSPIKPSGHVSQVSTGRIEERRRLEDGSYASSPMYYPSAELRQMEVRRYYEWGGIGGDRRFKPVRRQDIEEGHK